MNAKPHCKGAVAAGHDVTATAAATVLAEGGNAFDAAIAALLSACVCEPVLASPGGGGFMMARSADGTVRVIDFFCDTPIGKRPAEAVEFVEVFADFGTLKQAFHIGCGATATPGMMPGLSAIAGQFGTLPMADLAAPAVAAAKAGVVVTPFQAYLYDVVSPILSWTADARALFMPGGHLLKAGDLLVNPGLADALSLLGRGGHDNLCSLMVEAMTPELSHLTADDFKSYEPVIRDPVSVDFADATVWLNPRPALGGALVAAMLGAVNGSDDEAVVKAMAGTDRVWREHGIDALSPDPADSRQDDCGGQAPRGTTHVSVIDAMGNAVAATVSNGEGNGRIVPGCGFMMNNMLGEEDVNPDGFHNWTPGKRLSSMMTPAIVETGDGGLHALGSGGSNRIRTAIFQFLINRLVHDMPPQQAVQAPRLHFEKGRLDIECADDRAETARLRAAYGDHVCWPGRSLYFGGVHCVERRADGLFDGAGDPRREGAFRLA